MFSIGQRVIIDGNRPATVTWIYRTTIDVATDDGWGAHRRQCNVLVPDQGVQLGLPFPAASTVPQVSPEHRV